MSVDVSRETLHRIAVSRGRMPPDTGGRAWGGLKRLCKPDLPCTDEDPAQMSTSKVDNQMHPFAPLSGRDACASISPRPRFEGLRAFHVKQAEQPFR